MPHFAVTAVGADRPGIVAAVTGVFVEQGCNLEDTSMTILRGHFAMVLVVDAPPGVGPTDLEAALAAPAAAFDLSVSVRALDEAAVGSPSLGSAAGEVWTVSVYGSDHPGIVHGVTSLLAAHDVNVADLSTRVIGSAEHPVYAMVMEVELPAGVDAGWLGGELERLGGDLGVSVSLHRSEADIL